MEGGEWGDGLDGGWVLRRACVVMSTGCLYVSDESLNYIPETNMAPYVNSNLNIKK